MHSDHFFGKPGNESLNCTHQEAPGTQYAGLSASGDHLQSGIYLNEQFIRDKPATFFMRVNSNAMSGAGIFSGDTVVIDRSLKALNGKVVIAILNGEMLIRRFEQVQNKLRLLPETAALSPIEIDASCKEFAIWGVVTYVIHSV